MSGPDGETWALSGRLRAGAGPSDANFSHNFSRANSALGRPMQITHTLNLVCNLHRAGRSGAQSGRRGRATSGSVRDWPGAGAAAPPPQAWTSGPGAGGAVFETAARRRSELPARRRAGSGPTLAKAGRPVSSGRPGRLAHCRAGCGPSGADPGAGHPRGDCRRAGNGPKLAGYAGAAAGGREARRRGGSRLAAGRGGPSSRLPAPAPRKRPDTGQGAPPLSSGWPGSLALVRGGRWRVSP